MALTNRQRALVADILHGDHVMLDREESWDNDKGNDLMLGGHPLKETGERWDRRTADRLRTWTSSRRLECPTWLTAEEVAAHDVRPGPWTRPVELEFQGQATLVYNAAEIRGLPEDLYRPFWEIHPVHREPRHPGFERYVRSLNVKVRHLVERDTGRTFAQYDGILNVIYFPPFELFFSAHDYYRSLAHELVHWAAANTDLVETILASERADHARNELVAEFGSVFLLAEQGVADLPHPRAVVYIRKWCAKGSLTDAQAMDAAKDAARVAAWLRHEAPAWRAGDGGMRRQAPPDSRGRSRPRASPRGPADVPHPEAASAARQFVADAFALERASPTADRDARDREASRLLEVAQTIDLGIPAIVTAIEAAVALETSFATPRPSAASWLAAFRERTARTRATRKMARPAPGLSAGSPRGPRIR